jgi:hypothetical protein
VQLLLSDGITYSIVAYAAIGMNCAENTIAVLLFTGRCLVTAGCCDSTVLSLSECVMIYLLWGFMYFEFSQKGLQRDVWELPE